MFRNNLRLRLTSVALAAIALLALAACGSPAAPNAPAQPIIPNLSASPNSQAVAPTSPPATQNNPPGIQPTEPAAAPGNEGAGTEGGPSVASVTDPGGLPPSPPTNDPLINQIGDEKMVVHRESQGHYQVLFVNGWTNGPGDLPGSVKSASQDRSAQVAMVDSGGKSPIEYATADEARLKAAVPGYQTLVLKPGQIPYGPVASLIYRYQAGQNPVTGKSLNYIAARVYVPRQGSNDLAIITVTGPAQFYGDLSEIFDRIVTSFKWL